MMQRTQLPELGCLSDNFWLNNRKKSSLNCSNIQTVAIADNCWVPIQAAKC